MTVGRKSVEQIVHLQIISQILHRESPAVAKLLRRTIGLSPPKPIAIKLVKGPKDDRRQRAVLTPDSTNHFGNLLEFFFIPIVIFATGQQAAKCLLSKGCGHLPGVKSFLLVWLVEMPAKDVDHPTIVGSGGPADDLRLRVMKPVFLAVVLLVGDVHKIGTPNGRITSGGPMHVGFAVLFGRADLGILLSNQSVSSGIQLEIMKQRGRFGRGERIDELLANAG